MIQFEDEIHFLLICPTYKELGEKIGILEFDNLGLNLKVRNCFKLSRLNNYYLQMYHATRYMVLNATFNNISHATMIS